MNDLNSIRAQKFLLFFTSWAHTKVYILAPWLSLKQGFANMRSDSRRTRREFWDRNKVLDVFASLLLGLAVVTVILGILFCIGYAIKVASDILFFPIDNGFQYGLAFILVLALLLLFVLGNAIRKD